VQVVEVVVAGVGLDPVQREVVEPPDGVAVGILIAAEDELRLRPSR
jgi:hypothetical protein